LLGQGAGSVQGTKSTLVDSRLIYPVPSPTGGAQFEKKDPQWKLLTDNLLGPFGYTFPDPDPGYIRKYRLRAIYYDENAGGTYHIKVKIELPAGRYSRKSSNVKRLKVKICKAKD
jgi:hypothetical protein